MLDFGREQEVVLDDGRRFVLGRLRVRVLRAWRDWVAEQVGDPFADVDRLLGRAPDDEVRALLKVAIDTRDQLRYFSLACPLAQRFLGTELGGAKLFQLLLVRPEAPTEEDGLDVAFHLFRANRVAEVLRAAQGEGQRPNGGGASPGAPLATGPG